MRNAVSELYCILVLFSGELIMKIDIIDRMFFTILMGSSFVNLFCSTQPSQQDQDRSFLISYLKNRDSQPHPRQNSLENDFRTCMRLLPMPNKLVKIPHKMFIFVVNNRQIGKDMKYDAEFLIEQHIDDILDRKKTNLSEWILKSGEHVYVQFDTSGWPNIHAPGHAPMSFEGTYSDLNDFKIWTAAPGVTAWLSSQVKYDSLFDDIHNKLPKFAHDHTSFFTEVYLIVFIEDNEQGSMIDKTWKLRKIFLTKDELLNILREKNARQ